MPASRSLYAFLALGILLTAVDAIGQYPGIDGCNPGPCANATPCRHCTGSWSDNIGYTWNITTNLATGAVNGTASVPNPHIGCPVFVFQVSGTLTPTGGWYPYISGNTRVYLHATNPSPSSCGGVVATNGTVDVNIRNNGCDIAAGVAQNDDGTWYYNAYSMARIPDVPAGESTDPVGWWSLYPTFQQFRQTLQGQSGRPFDGRQVTEAPGQDHYDECYYQGAADQGFSQFGVTGGWWIVGRWATPPFHFYSNVWIDDYVGMTPALVNLYQQSRAPCYAYAQQVMTICTNGPACTYKSQYFQGYITYTVNSDSIIAGRNGQYASKPWP